MTPKHRRLRGCEGGKGQMQRRDRSWWYALMVDHQLELRLQCGPECWSTSLKNMIEHVNWNTCIYIYIMFFQDRGERVHRICRTVGGAVRWYGTMVRWYGTMVRWHRYGLFWWYDDVMQSWQWINIWFIWYHIEKFQSATDGVFCSFPRSPSRCHAVRLELLSPKNTAWFYSQNSHITPSVCNDFIVLLN